MYILDNLFMDLRKIINSVIIKYDKRAKDNENINTVRESDKYISAMTAQDSFSTYASFDKEAIIAAGVVDLELAESYHKNKQHIPLHKRNDIVLKQRERIIKNYVEKNNYYRMLYGLPNMEDFDFIYVDLETCQKLGINPNTPLHELSKEEIILLNDLGKIKGYIEKYPQKEYLMFLGSSKIDIVRARTAKNFTILNMSKAISENLYTDFNNIYEQCREYFMSVIYNKEYAKNYDMYDNFIAMMIMVMTIQRIISNTFKNGIERDFYDLGSIELMFKAYNVPFLSDVPIDYQRVLLRNLNNLLRYKSTDKVLFDICSLLGLERIKIYKYMLVKQHVLDIDEKPVFLYKEVVDDEGNVSLVEDKEKMYKFYFQTVELRERNTALALSNNTNKLSYDQVVLDDPYWWNDEDLTNQLYEEEFNYIETKYLNMNIMYKMTEMLFEVMYIFRMLLDKKSEETKIDLDLPKMFYNRKVNIFDAVVMMCALLTKKNKLKGNILFTPSKVLSVMGFNFKADFDTIRKYIRDNPSLIDHKILKYFEKLNLSQPEDVNALFVNIREFNDFIVNKMARSENIDEYHAYKKIFHAVMITENTGELFKKKDGTVATTFLDYLEDHDAELYNFVITAEEGRIAEYVDHILYKINNLITDAKYLYIVNDSNNALVNAVVALTRFFKSYTTDLVSMNILYLFDSRYYNMIKLIGDIRSIEKNMSINDSTNLSYHDMVKSLTKSFQEEDFITFFNRTLMSANIYHNEIVPYEEKQEYHAVIEDINEYEFLKDVPYIIKELIIKKYFTLKEKLYLAGKIYPKEFLGFEHVLDISKELDIRFKYLIKRIDIYLSKLIQANSDVLSKFREKQSYHVDILNEFDIPYTEVLEYAKSMGLTTFMDMSYSDVIHMYKDYDFYRKLDLKGQWILQKEIPYEDTQKLIDRFIESEGVLYPKSELKDLKNIISDVEKEMKMLHNLYTDDKLSIHNSVSSSDVQTNYDELVSSHVDFLLKESLKRINHHIVQIQKIITKSSKISLSDSNSITNELDVSDRDKLVDRITSIHMDVPVDPDLMNLKDKLYLISNEILHKVGLFSWDKIGDVSTDILLPENLQFINEISLTASMPIESDLLKLIDWFKLEGQIFAPKEFYSLNTHKYKKDIILYPELDVNMLNTINSVNKLMKIYQSLLMHYSDLAHILVSTMRKDKLGITDKIRIVYEQ